MSWIGSIVAAWKDATTERDGETKCPVRLGAIGTTAIYHAAAVWMVFGQETKIDIAMLGLYIQHMSMLIGVGALGIGAKSVMKGDSQ